MFRLGDSSSDDENPRSTSSVPFPALGCSSPTTLAPPQRPQVSRTTSSPILLSNGKPLKPSLKSSLKPSSSSPSLPTGALSPHSRARSEPSTPLITPKNVHFPSQEEGGLVSVRVFNRSAKPASVSKPPGCDDTETETETEAAANNRGNNNNANATTVPWPSSSSYFQSVASPTTGRRGYELDPARCSSIPRKAEPPSFGNVHLEDVQVKLSAPKPAATGHILVRNVAYEKHVAVRFTLDEWQTTSEVTATHVVSLARLPEEFIVASSPSSSSSSSLTIGDLAAPAAPRWDRFSFTINLEDYALNLDQKTMWLVVRYTIPVGGGDESLGGQTEWWDNNSGGNYRIGFRAITSPTAPSLSPVADRMNGTLTMPKLATPAPPLPVTRSSSASAAGSFSHHHKFYSYPHSSQTLASAYSGRPIMASIPAYHRQTHQQQQQQQQRHQYLLPANRALPPHLRDDEDDYDNEAVREREREREHAAHQAALTQTTLSRLKKLNLRNYAAPAPSPNVSPVSSRRSSISTGPMAPPAPPPAITVTSSSPPLSGQPESLTNSSSSSAETTPASSPKPGFLGLGFSFMDPRKDEFGMEMGMEFNDGAPATPVVGIGGRTGTGMHPVEEWSLSTSPPFSVLGEFGRQEHTPTVQQGSPRMHHSPPPIAATQNAPAHPPRRVRRGSPPRSSWVKSVGSLEHGSRSASSSSSASEKEEDVKEHPPSPMRLSSSNSNSMASLLDVIKEKSTYGGGRHHRSPNTSGSGSGSRSSSASSGSDSDANDDGVIYTRSSASSSPRRETPTPTRSMTPTMPTQTQGQTDSVYQAFVKQWCFAQGTPGPGVAVM